ncbi:hypothetical protein [Pseudoxanthomonas mexicana]
MALIADQQETSHGLPCTRTNVLRWTTASGAGSSSPPVLPRSCSLWQFLAAIEALFSPREAAERTVTARGDLAADEKATIELFEKSRASVVYITTAQLVRDVWTRNVFSMPRGTGWGFVWRGCRPRRHQLPRHPGCF